MRALLKETGGAAVKECHSSVAAASKLVRSSTARRGGQRVDSATAGGGRGNVASTMRVCAFDRGSVALSVAVLVGVLAVVAVGVSMIFK